MGLKEAISYYGRLDGPPPARTLVQDLLAERKKIMAQEMKDMEDRIKRHITECKREIIRELQAIFTVPKSKIELKKELKHVG